MNNKKTITYKIMSQNELSNVGTVTITENSINIQGQSKYANAIKSIGDDVAIRGDFSKVRVETVKDDTVRIANVSDKYINAIKEECLLKLGLVWV